MKRIIYSVLLLIIGLCISQMAITMTGGPPEGYSNAPGEGNCANPGCHGGTEVTSGTVWNSIQLSVTGTTLSNLVENTAYTFTLSVSDPSIDKYGFQLCVLPTGATSGTPSLGSLSTISSETQLVSSPDRTYLEHTSSGTTATGGNKSWSFTWQTPSGYNGGAVFYVVVNAANNNGSSGGDVIYAKTFNANVALPVTWIDYRVFIEPEGAKLQWTTGSEEHNAKFDIERSIDMRNWEAIGTIKGAGTSSIKKSYTYLDQGIKGTWYYRIKQTDFDGKFSYSGTMLFSSEAVPSQQGVYYDYNEQKLHHLPIGSTISIINLKGEQLVYQMNTEASMAVDHLPRGIYWVLTETADPQKTEVKKFYK